MFKWSRGRQETGYLKHKFFSFKKPFRMDMWLLKYEVGEFIPPHIDPVDGFKHYRLNIILRKAEGGIFECPKCIVDLPRIKLFRPDVYEHSLSPVTKGTRYVLSVGMAL